MADIVTNLGIQSWCFRHFKTHGEVIANLKACGVSAIELCRVHVDFGNAEASADAVRQYAEAGVRILSIGVERIGDNKEAARPCFEFLRRAGASFMSIDFAPSLSPASWRVAEALADEYDVRLGLHNHGGRHWLGSAAMLNHVLANTGERIGVSLDTAWALDSREDPVAMVRKFGRRVHGLHIKDFVFNRAGKPEDVVVGTGNLNLPGLLGALDEVGFDGFAVIEYEGDVENPVPALTNCVEAVQDART